MSEHGRQRFLAVEGVEENEAAAAWILADRAGNRVCVAAWPGGSVSERRR